MLHHDSDTVAVLNISHKCQLAKLKTCISQSDNLCKQMDWTEQCFTSPPTQYRLYGRRFLQVKRPNQQYQSTEGTNSTPTIQ